MSIHYYNLQRFIQLARGSYVYFVEYIWKNDQREETKTKKVRNGDVTSQETLLIDENEEQG